MKGALLSTLSAGTGANFRSRAHDYRRSAQSSGTLRISVGTPYAHYRLLPLLPKFQAKYPQIEIELNISNRVIDFVEEGFDLAIRLGIPKDSRLIARTLEDATLGVLLPLNIYNSMLNPKRLQRLISISAFSLFCPVQAAPCHGFLKIATAMISITALKVIDGFMMMLWGV